MDFDMDNIAQTLVPDLIKDECAKDIEGWEGLYAITNYGRVWSFRRKIFLKPDVSNSGYFNVSLFKNGKRKRCYIHRLVAEAFVPNTNNKSEINHIDENKENNKFTNLEWVTRLENMNYGAGRERSSDKNKVSIRCVELDIIFSSITFAANELGLSQGNISNCLRGRRCTAGGYHFEYA